MTSMFDEQRRAWIAAHAGILLFQKRRAELLGKRIRAAERARIGARPDPHDDQVTPPLVFRTASTSTGAVESVLVAVCAVAAPLGWSLGRLLYDWITTLIPHKLQAYPIPALIWVSVLSGAPLPLLFDPAPGLWSMLVMPWLLAQIPATFLAAGVYGVLEGWLAVDGSTDWWPLTPAAPEVDDDLLLGPAEVAMPTVLDAVPAPREPVAIPRKSTPPTIRWVPMISGIVLASIGVIWYCWAVGSTLLHYPLDAVDSSGRAGTQQVCGPGRDVYSCPR
ncbi:hypothetical protein PJI20_10135 [Mycobacterium kansasii]